MNTIVFPTDFSAYSENALHYAASLAQRVRGSLLLLNVYQLPVTINEPPVLTVLPEDLKANADNELHRMQEALNATYPDVQVKTESRLGDLNDELEDLCKNVRPFAVVSGRYDFKGVERLLFGDTSLSIIRRSQYPVIVTPDSYEEMQLDNVAMAVDATPDPYMQLQAQKISEALGSRLHVIHVRAEKEQETELRNKLLPGLNARFHIIEDDDFVQGISEYIKRHQVDLLIIFPHRHSAVERLIIRTHTKSIIEKVPIPVLCMPENEERES